MNKNSPLAQTMGNEYIIADEGFRQNGDAYCNLTSTKNLRSPPMTISGNNKVFMEGSFSQRSPQHEVTVTNLPNQNVKENMLSTIKTNELT